MRRCLLLGALLLVLSTTAWGYEIKMGYPGLWPNPQRPSNWGSGQLPWPTSILHATAVPWLSAGTIGLYNPYGYGDPCGNPCGYGNPCGGSPPCSDPCPSPTPCQSPCMDMIMWPWLMMGGCTPDCGYGCY
jgi:hypothetical protein